MEGKRFDDLTRLVGRGASRRSILKGLLGLGGAAAVGSVGSEGAGARTLSTRPSLTTSPPPPPPPTTTTPAPLCGPDEEQCPFSTICCPTGTCARSGNQAICCDGTNGAGTVPCGLDCCDDPYQCCDRECCADGDVCLGRVYNNSSEGFEEHCCPAELTCDGQCCDGECYVADGFPLAFNGYPFRLNLADRSCCPTGNSVCQGIFNATCCDDATEECCVDNLGTATCIPIGGCCTDEQCEDPCLVCDLETTTCANPCAGNTEGEFCCPSEGPDGFVCLPFGDCCPGDATCGECGDCPDGACAPFDGFCEDCKHCVLDVATGEFVCEGDPEQAGDLCDQCRVCDTEGNCAVDVEDGSSCPSFVDGVCCSGECTSPEIGCPTTTTIPPTTTTTTDPGTTTTGLPTTTTTGPTTTTTASPCGEPCGPGLECCEIGPTCIDPEQQCCTAADCPAGDPRFCEVAVCREYQCDFDSECNFENERCCPNEQGNFACTLGFTCPGLSCSSVDDCVGYGLDLDCVVCSDNVCRPNEGSCHNDPCRPCAEPGICGIEDDETPCGEQSICCSGECTFGNSCEPPTTTTQPPTTTTEPPATTTAPTTTTTTACVTNGVGCTAHGDCCSQCCLDIDAGLICLPSSFCQSMTTPPPCTSDTDCEDCEVCNLATGACETCSQAGMLCCGTVCRECCGHSDCRGCLACSGQGTCVPGSCADDICQPGICEANGDCTLGTFNCLMNPSTCCETGIECTARDCQVDGQCGAPYNLPYMTPCNGGTGFCQEGICQQF